MAILADSRAVLLQRLEEFVDEQPSTGIYTGQAKKRTNDTALFEDADEDAQWLLRTWSQKKKLAKIAPVWARGVNIDWKLLYTVGAESAPVQPHRVSLPTYPFALERYWLPLYEQTHKQRGSHSSIQKKLLDSVVEHRLSLIETPLQQCIAKTLM